MISSTVLYELPPPEICVCVVFDRDGAGCRGGKAPTLKPTIDPVDRTCTHDAAPSAESVLCVHTIGPGVVVVVRSKQGTETRKQYSTS